MSEAFIHKGAGILKIGKISESILKRSVLKQIKTKRNEILIGAGIGEDCAILSLKEDEVVVLSTDPITGTTKDIGELSIHVTINDIASSGAEPIGVLLTILLPPESEEATLKEIMISAQKACTNLGIQIAGGHTEVTDAVNQPIITVTGIGKVKRSACLKTANAKPGQDIVVSKYIGLEGTSILAKSYPELLEKFPQTFIRNAAALDRCLSVVPEAVVAVKTGVSAMHDITEGGIFGALWEMAEGSRVGLEVDLKKIPIRQETVEICNYFDLNPYLLMSSGSMLMVTDKGPELVKNLIKENIQAAIIGKITSGNDRVIWNDDEKRFLEPPKSDELYKVREKNHERKNTENH